MTARYGDFVRYRPPLQARTAVLWAGPVVLLGAGLLALGLVLRQRARLDAAQFEPDPEHDLDPMKARPPAARSPNDERPREPAARAAARTAPAPRFGPARRGTLAASSAGLERALLDAVLPRQPRPRGRSRGTRRLGLLALLVAGIGGLAYAALGAPGTAERPPAGFEQAGAEASPARAPHALGRSEMEALVEQLATRLKANPADAEAGPMLGRSYSTLQRSGRAIAAYRQALQLRPDDAALLADLADALAVAGGRSLEGEAGPAGRTCAGPGPGPAQGAGAGRHRCLQPRRPRRCASALGARGACRPCRQPAGGHGARGRCRCA